jgi:vacuolar-type H+-ATPase subunit F/Vma7
MPKDSPLDNPLAVLGDKDLVLGFKALGFKVWAAEDSQGYKTALDEIIANRVAVCMVQDNIYQAIKDQINNYKSLPLPVFIPFSKTKDTRLLDGILKDIRLKATGAF